MSEQLPIENRRFRELRQELELTQQTFADILQIRGSIADIERGKTRLSGAVVSKLLQQYRINPLWMFGESDQKHLEAEQSVSPRVITLDQDSRDNIVMVNVKASAGYAHNLQDPDWYDQLPAFSLPLPEYRNASFRAFQVQGDSMIPSILPGEWLIARAEENVSAISQGQIYVVVLGDTVVVKKTLRTEKGLALISLNPAYPPIYVSGPEIRELWKVTARITTQLEQPAGSLEELTREMREGFVEMRSLLKK